MGVTQPDDKEPGAHDGTQCGGVIIKCIIRIKWFAFILLPGSFGKVGCSFLKTLLPEIIILLRFGMCFDVPFRVHLGHAVGPGLVPGMTLAAHPGNVATCDFFGLGRYKMVNQWFIWNCSSTVW